jgi:dTDP-D-glucose 4,6-dehydratase
VALIEAEKDDGIYNVAGGFEQKNIDTVSKVIECYFGEKRNLSEYLDLSYAREGQDVRYALNDNKLRSIGWSPQKSFDHELKHIVEHYKNNFKW